MIRRVVALALLFAGLAGLCAVSRASLESRGAGEWASGLLYLPKGPFLRAMAVGHEDTLADLLYVWAIQYYSNYDDKTRSIQSYREQHMQQELSKLREALRGRLNPRELELQREVDDVTRADRR